MHPVFGSAPLLIRSMYRENTVGLSGPAGSTTHGGYVGDGRSARFGVPRALAAIVATTIVWTAASFGAAATAGADTGTDPGTASSSSAPQSVDAPSSDTATAGTPTSNAPADTGTGDAGDPTTSIAISPAGTESGTAQAGAGSTAATSASPTDGSPADPNAAPSPSNSTVNVSGGTDPNVTSLTAADVLPSVALMRQAVSKFLISLLNALPAGSAPALNDGASPGAICRCTVAIALSARGDARATANPSTPSAPGTGVTLTATPGPTGFVNSVAISADGDANAAGTSGSVGLGNSTSHASAHVASSEIVTDVTMSPAAVVGAVDSLSHSMLTANGSVNTNLNLTPCAKGCSSFKHGDVEVAVLPTCAGIACPATNAHSCWASDVSAPGGVWCTIAIAITFRGDAHASIVTSDTTSGVGAPCGSLAGGVISEAIAERGDAHAIAVMGSSPTCAPQVPDAMHAAVLGPTATAASGATGNALGVSIAGNGDADTTATSGNSGPVTAIGGNGTDASATANTGSTGDAIGIAMAKLSATAQVRSGNSGRAATVCTGCSGATTPNGDDAVAISASGNTGLSFSLAVAGLQATVNSSSGDSGDSVGFVMDGNGSGSSGGSGTSGSPGSVYVAGRSGNTGDTVVVALGMSSWVNVLGYTGQSGPVLSTANAANSSCDVVVSGSTANCGNPATTGAGNDPAKNSTDGSGGGTLPVTRHPLPGSGLGGGERSPAVVEAAASAAPLGTALPPTAVASALINNKPIQVTTLTATKHAHTDTVPATRVGSTVVTGGNIGIPAADVSPALNAAPGSTWSIWAEFGIAAILIALVVMACRYGRAGE
jgi:hypothetical protein